MKINDVIDEINEVVTWYRSLPMDYTGINELMYQRVQIVTLLTYFSTELGECRIQWKNAEIETERKKRSKTIEYLEDGNPLSKSQEYAKFESLEEFANEKRFDGAYNSMRLFYDSTNKVIDAINQHISNLKREETLTKMTQV